MLYDGLLGLVDLAYEPASKLWDDHLSSSEGLLLLYQGDERSHKRRGGVFAFVERLPELATEILHLSPPVVTFTGLREFADVSEEVFIVAE